jgi:hypothetical protein
MTKNNARNFGTECTAKDYNYNVKVEEKLQYFYTAGQKSY